MSSITRASAAVLIVCAAGLAAAVAAPPTKSSDPKARTISTGSATGNKNPNIGNGWQPARSCNAAMSGYGQDINRAASEKAAVSQWSVFVNAAFGEEWSHWSDASNKAVTCSQGPGGIFYCQAKGNPCH